MYKEAFFYWDQYEIAKDQMDFWERRVEFYGKIYETAEINYENAESRESGARSSYKIAQTYCDKARRAYLDHTNFCSECRGSMLCPIGWNLYHAWQSWEEAKKDAKEEWDEAKADLNVKRGLKNSAHRNWSNADSQLGSWTQKANNRLSTSRAKKKAAEEAGDLLARLKNDLEVKKALLELATGQINKAKERLNNAEQNNPKQWEESMKDPDIKNMVDEIRNY